MSFASKQISKIISAPIKITNQAVGSGNSNVTVTSAITSALSVAGNNGVAVPVQVSSSVLTQGVIVSSPLNRVDVYDSTSKDKLVSANNDEVYARLTYSSGYILSFYYLNSSGVEQAFTFTSSINIDFDFTYRFSFGLLPADALVSSLVRNVNQDPAGAGLIFKVEKLTVTGVNTLSNISLIPVSAATTKLTVWGKSEYAVGASPSFSLAGNVITWNATNAGYSLETTDVVYVEYYV